MYAEGGRGKVTPLITKLRVGKLLIWLQSTIYWRSWQQNDTFKSDKNTCLCIILLHLFFGCRFMFCGLDLDWASYRQSLIFSEEKYFFDCFRFVYLSLCMSIYLTDPYWFSWAPMDCMMLLRSWLGAVNWEVPVSTMAWQPWEHQPDSWPLIWNLHGDDKC